MGQSVDDRAEAAIDRNVFESTIRCLSSDFHSHRQVAAEDHYREKICALNLVRDAVISLDSNGQVTYLNRAAENLYGWRSEEIIGRSARTTLFTDGEETFDHAWRTVHDEEAWCGEIKLTRSGRERLVESRWSTIRNQQFGIISILVLGAEISANTMTASFAHEIRNPLAGIKGVADAFLQRGQLTLQEREWMEAIRCEVVKIDARMREVLDASQPPVVNVKPCLLSDLISGVVQLATHQVKSINHHQGRHISVELIDATTTPLVMSLDAAKIEDAVLNLVLNAIESIKGNGRVAVTVRTVSTGNGGDGEALIEVSDNGSGIPLEVRRRIFEPRFTTKREGSGLGLAAVRRTAAEYHGRINFKTRVGRGSKFVLALPLRSQPNLVENRK
jgi:two-component system, cell cycle sensor histidine kinase and response regulator CckA